MPGRRSDPLHIGCHWRPNYDVARCAGMLTLSQSLRYLPKPLENLLVSATDMTKRSCATNIATFNTSIDSSARHWPHWPRPGQRLFRDAICWPVEKRHQTTCPGPGSILRAFCSPQNQAALPVKYSRTHSPVTSGPGATLRASRRSAILQSSVAVPVSAAATSRNRLSGFRCRHNKACAWFVRNVHPAGSTRPIAGRAVFTASG